MGDHDHLYNQDPLADSAGVPWEGRSFEPNNFSGDDGSADAALVKAITALRASTGSVEAVVDAFRSARLLVPLLAKLGESEVGAHGVLVDKSAELSIVTVETPDQQNGLPVFSSVESMKVWNADARPVPVDAVKAALAAAQEGNTRIILDAASPTEFVIRRPAIAAVAQGLPWVHPVKDERVRAAFAAATDASPEILGFELYDIDPQSVLVAAEVQLELRLVPDLERDELDRVMQSLAKALAESHDIAEYVDSLRVKLVS
jgi:hypothetical protein